MTQLTDNIQPTDTTLLQDVLRLVAKSPNLKSVAPIILEKASHMMDASAGFYSVFEDPNLLFVYNIDADQMPDPETIESASAGLTQDIHISNNLPQALATSYKGWLLIPIMYKRKPAGVFCLLFANEMTLSDTSSNLLLSLVDSLTIVTTTEKVQARHNKLMQNQNEFVRIVSHDLRSPLTSIKGFASMLESAEEDPKLLHFVVKILSGVTQMTSLVDNIQDAGRYDPETGFYEMDRTPTDLIDMVHKIVNTHLVPAEKEELTLGVNIDNDIPIVNIDANMIERSIINLVDNAIKYTPNGGRIEVGLQKDKGDLLITISDNGYGISEENRRQLFNRHFRIRRREHTRVKGSGLGLFIVRSVARHHNGDAFVESVENEGSTFGIRIPLSGENLLGGSA
ncbi:MAG: HAMP domain-containing sensor histidine kinase [Phototrophicaceae bacterium]